jgi:hypothetical protein
MVIKYIILYKNNNNNVLFLRFLFNMLRFRQKSKFLKHAKKNFKKIKIFFIKIKTVLNFEL